MRRNFKVSHEAVGVMREMARRIPLRLMNDRNKVANAFLGVFHQPNQTSARRLRAIQWSDTS